MKKLVIKDALPLFTREENDVKQIPIDANATGYIIVKYAGLAAKEMGDQINVTIYNAKGQAISNTWSDSVMAYALRILRRESTAADPTLKQLIPDLLAYGAAAQTFFGYNTENLVTAQMTEEELDLITTDVNLEHTLDQGSYHFGSSLTLVSNIVFMMAMQNVADDMTIVATYTDHLGAKHTVDTYQASGNLKILTFDQMVVADARQVITVTISDKDGNVVGTCNESIADYLARQANASDLFKAIAAFSDSAYAYLHKNDGK
jgi:hypothetical protein